MARRISLRRLPSGCNRAARHLGFVCDIVQAYDKTLPRKRREEVGFKDNRLVREWIRGFLERWPRLGTCTAADLDSERADSITPHNVTAIFA